MKRIESRKNITPIKPMVFIAGIICIILLMLILAPDTAKRTVSGFASNGPIKASDTEGIVPGGFAFAKVTRIVDGDTLEAKFLNNEDRNKEYKVRLLCIDTPETVKSGVGIQPYGKKATEKLSKMVLNKVVMVIFEKDVKDNYGRLLAYIMLEDGSCANAVLVEQGYARVEIVRPNNVHKDYFYELQNKAIKEKKGLWSLPVKERPFIENEKGFYVPHYIDKEAA